MTMLTAPVDAPTADAAELRASAALFRALADRNRLAILRHLSLGEHRVVDLTAHLGLAQSTVSTHCACLADCGLVTARPRGRATVYSLARSGELEALLTAADRLREVTDDAAARCATSAAG